MDSDTVDRVIEQNRNDARFYVGLVLWQPGELENELQRGFWYVMDHDAGLVFRKTPTACGKSSFAGRRGR